MHKEKTLCPRWDFPGFASYWNGPKVSSGACRAPLAGHDLRLAIAVPELGLAYFRQISKPQFKITW